MTRTSGPSTLIGTLKGMGLVPSRIGFREVNDYPQPSAGWQAPIPFLLRVLSLPSSKRRIESSLVVKEPIGPRSRCGD